MVDVTHLSCTYQPLHPPLPNTHAHLKHVHGLNGLPIRPGHVHALSTVEKLA